MTGRSNPSRRSLLLSGAALTIASPFVQLTSARAQGREIVVASWGGSRTTAMREVMFAPFEKATGIRVRDEPEGSLCRSAHTVELAACLALGQADDPVEIRVIRPGHGRAEGVDHTHMMADRERVIDNLLGRLRRRAALLEKTGSQPVEHDTAAHDVACPVPVGSAEESRCMISGRRGSR